MANEPKRIDWLLLCLLSPEVELNDWEQKFVESIEKQVKQKKEYQRTHGKEIQLLTDTQYEKLEEIYERKTQ